MTAQAVYGCFALIGALTSCASQGSEPTRTADKTAELTWEVGQDANRHLTSDFQVACSATATPASPDWVVVVTADQCMSCLEIGSLLRNLRRDASAEGKRLMVAAPVRDVDAVCSFLRREKVVVPVVALPSRVGRSLSDARRVVYFETGSASGPARVESARSGPDLLKMIREPTAGSRSSGSATPADRQPVSLQGVEK